MLKNMANSKNVIRETNKCSMLDTCCGFLRELYLLCHMPGRQKSTREPVHRLIFSINIYNTEDSSSSLVESFLLRVLTPRYSD